MLEKTLIDLAHRHFKIMWRYEAMTNSIIIHVEKQYGQQRYQQNYRITFEEIGCSGGFELSMIVLLNRMADTINRAIETTDDSV